MSDAESFIREVTDEVRRDRLFRLWRRYGPFVIGGIAAVVALAAALAWLEHRELAAARAAGGRLMEAASAERPAERLLAEAEALEGGAAALARLQAAAAQVAAGEVEPALEIYRSVAAGTEAPQALAEYAALRAAFLLAESGDEAGAMAGYDALAGADSVWRALALEARGALKLRQGDYEGAREDLQAAADDALATDQTRERAGALLEVVAARTGAPAEAAQETPQEAPRDGAQDAAEVSE